MKQLELYLIIACLAVAVGLLSAKILAQRDSMGRLETDMGLLLESNDSLTLKIRDYKVRDSLSAAQVRSLRLTTRELKKYRADDAELIKDLRIRAKDLESLANTRLETRDTVFVALRDTAPGTAHFSYTSEWTDLSGTVNIAENTARIDIANREDLEIVSSVTRKRFLGFLWYRRKIEGRQIDVVSRNPNTTITNVSYIELVK